MLNYVKKSILNRVDERKNGPREESEVAGVLVFSLIRMMGYFRLVQVMLVNGL